MKILTFVTLTFCIAMIPLLMKNLASGASYAGFKATFADAAWDGKTVPKGRQCKRFDGKDPSTPKLMVVGIPADANAIVMEYSDRSYPPMDNGGHGKIGYTIPEGTKEITIPPVPGHSFELPEKFFIVAPHQAPGWDEAGAYMPPCSGGNGNKYYVTIKAVVFDEGKTDSFKDIAQVVLEMGIY
ncbi:MAG: hypothetical protein JRI53_01065 [Deltaproteobacteria bacterium]|nr:hypothetical protein [Deltaproteobacteria bacterium]MBW1983282.1 hypothetical protein [Deltaproteobacteria bacterium]